MSFHSDFWVVAGTAAPVIALSSILLINDQLDFLGGVLDAEDLASKDESLYGSLSFRATFLYTLNASSLVIQVAVFVSALLSLATEKNFISLMNAAYFQACGLFLLFISSGFMAGSKYRLKRFNDKYRRQIDVKANAYAFRRLAKAHPKPTRTRR